MKNLLPMNTAWSRSVVREPGPLSLPGTNKKFKRKSREPKRLFPMTPPSESLRMELDSVEDTGLEVCHVTKLLPVQRHVRGSQEAVASTSGFLREDISSSASGALDMRIGINVPSITSRRSPLSAPAFPEISNWPPSISQPLTNRLKHITSFPGSASGSSRSASLHTFSMELPGSASSAGPAPPAGSPAHEHMEAQVPSPKSPRKRVVVEGHGRLPEVKAIQQTRRLLANARERTRVHTISAAFEALRKQVPCYSYGQKLSKLAILRIACNYILSLAQLAEVDHSPDPSALSFSQCVEQCTRTLQAEGRSKKRKVGRLADDV